MKSLEDLEDAFETGLLTWEKEIVKKKAAVMGHKAVREIKRLTKVVTGNLRRRWFFTVEEKDGEIIIWISNDAEYAAPVNYGHRIVRGGKTVGKAQGRFMLEEGIQVYVDAYMQQDIEEMLEELKRAMRS